MRRDGVWSSKRNKVVYGVSVVLLGRVCKASARAATDGQMSRIHSQTGSSRPFEPLGAGSQAFREKVCKQALVARFSTQPGPALSPADSGISTRCTSRLQVPKQG